MFSGETDISRVCDPGVHEDLPDDLPLLLHPPGAPRPPNRAVPHPGPRLLCRGVHFFIFIFLSLWGNE